MIVLLSLLIASLPACYQPSVSPSLPVTVETLVRLLQDSDALVRRTAAEALGKIGDHQAVPGLVLSLDDPSSIVRESSAHSLSQLGSLDMVTRERIAGLLLDPVPTVRNTAAQTLAALDSPKRIWPMALSQLDHHDPDVRRAVIQALEGVDSPEGLKKLESSLQDPDPGVRRAAVIALAESGVPTVSVQLRERLTSDTSSDVRAESAYRLQFFSAGEADEGLQFVALHDESVQVRRWIEQTLRGLKAHGSDSTLQPIPPAVPGRSHRYQ